MTLLWLFALLWLLGWVLAQPFMPLAIDWLTQSRGHAQSQPRRILIVCALPWLVPLTATLAMVALALAKSLGWVNDHCLSHDAHHPHFCFEHWPQMLIGHGHWHVVIAVTMAMIFGLLAARCWHRYRRQSARLSVLAAMSRGKGLRRVLEDTRLMAFAAGGKVPRIYLSQGLLDELNRRERRMVIAHEAAHIRYRDIQAGHLMEVLLLLHFRPLANQLRDLWRDAIECRADERVARCFGRAATAELLLRLGRRAQPAPVATAFGGGSLVTRIQNLLVAEVDQGETPAFEVVVATSLLALLAAFVANHHAVETLLGLVIKL